MLGPRHVKAAQDADVAQDLSHLARGACRPTTRSRRRSCSTTSGAASRWTMPLADWYARYQTGLAARRATTGSASPIRARRPTRSTPTLQQAEETHVDGMLRSIEDSRLRPRADPPSGSTRWSGCSPPLRFTSITGCRCWPRTSGRWRRAGASRSRRRCRRPTRCGASSASPTGWRSSRLRRPGLRRSARAKLAARSGVAAAARS